MFAGLKYAEGVLVSFLENSTAALILSILALSALEIAASISLSKIFKFSIKTKISNILAPSLQ
jgi:hypothetical protein